MFASLVDRSATPPHMHHAASSEALPSTSCIDPAHKQQPRRRSSGRPRGAGRSLLRRAPRPSGGRRIARTGPSLVVPPATGPRCCTGPLNARAGARNTPSHACRCRAVCPLNARAEPHVPATRGQMRRMLPCRVGLQRSAPLDQPMLQAPRTAQRPTAGTLRGRRSARAPAPHLCVSVRPCL